jgi:hypothetical protein
MSQSVQEVLNAISEASAALNREPEYKSTIQTLENTRRDLEQHNQRLELHITDYKRTIDELQSKCRSLEVERDDMGFRELEAQDKLDALRLVVKSFASAIDPYMPKPVEIKQATDIANAALEKVGNEVGNGPNPDYHPPQVDDPRLPEKPVNEMGQSEPNPTSNAAFTTESQPETASSNPSTSGAAVSESAALAPPTAKPYFGLTYTQAFGPTYAISCSREQWIEGGGSDSDYLR